MLARMKRVLGRAPKLIGCFTYIMSGLIWNALCRKLLGRFCAAIAAELRAVGILGITLVTKSDGHFPSVY